LPEKGLLEPGQALLRENNRGKRPGKGEKAKRCKGWIFMLFRKLDLEASGCGARARPGKDGWGFAVRTAG
jgi:hypothetical protein